MLAANLSSDRPHLPVPAAPGAAGCRLSLCLAPSTRCRPKRPRWLLRAS